MLEKNCNLFFRPQDATINLQRFTLNDQLRPNYYTLLLNYTVHVFYVRVSLKIFTKKEVLNP